VSSQVLSAMSYSPCSKRSFKDWLVTAICIFQPVVVEVVEFYPGQFDGRLS
jgi:hypothetical protein